MKRPLFALALMLPVFGAVAAPQAAVAQAVIEDLTPQSDGPLYCNSALDFCLGVDQDGPFATSRTLRSEIHLWDLPEVPKGLSKAEFLPQLIRLDEERAFVGVIVREETPYSGGIFEARDLYLFEASLGEVAGSNNIGTIPISRDISVRACFDAEDQERRGEACSDQYAFKTDLSLVPVEGAIPEFSVTTSATRYPKGASRLHDSTRAEPIMPADLIDEPDQTCSYAARYRYDADYPGFLPANPLPDCAEFLKSTL